MPTFTIRPLRSERPPQNTERLLDYLLSTLALKNDAALGRLLEMSPPHISKLRHRRLVVTGDTLLRMADTTGLSVATLRQVLEESPA